MREIQRIDSVQYSGRSKSVYFAVKNHSFRKMLNYDICQIQWSITTDTEEDLLLNIHNSRSYI